MTPPDDHRSAYDQTRELADALADDFQDSIADLRKRAKGEAVDLPVHTGHGY